MANNQPSVFQPLTAQDFAGPFSGALTPPSPSQTANPSQVPPGISNGGGVAMAASAFLEGATKARIKAYENRENEKLQKLNQLNAYMANTLPTLTPEGQEKAKQIYMRALGQEALGAMGKGGKQKQGDQQNGMAHHFTNVLRDVATGMVGGKMPKGAKNLDLHSVIGQIEAETGGQQYNRDAILKANESEVANKLKDFDGTYEQAQKLIAPNLAAMSALDPQRAAGAEASYLGGFQRAPAIGSAADIMDRDQRLIEKWSGGGAVPGVAGQGQQTPEQVVRSSLGMVLPGADRESAEPPEAVLPSGVRQAFEREGMVRKGDAFEDANGRIYRGSIIDTPNGPQLYDQANRLVNVDVGSLIPYGGRKQVNIVDPNHPTQARSAMRDASTGLLYDNNGLPLPPEQQSWEEGNSIYRQPSQGGGHWFVNDKNQIVRANADGTTTVVSGQTARQAPDRWMQRFKIQEGMKADDALKQAATMFQSEKQRITRMWDGKMASVEKDFPGLKPKEIEAKKQEIKKSRDAEIQGLKDDYSDMAHSLGQLYTQDLPEPTPDTSGPSPKPKPAQKPADNDTAAKNAVGF